MTPAERQLLLAVARATTMTLTATSVDYQGQIAELYDLIREVGGKPAMNLADDVRKRGSQGEET